MKCCFHKCYFHSFFRLWRIWRIPIQTEEIKISGWKHMSFVFTKRLREGTIPLWVMLSPLRQNVRMLRLH